MTRAVPVVSATLLLLMSCAGAASSSEPVDIGSRLELFVDDALIDSLDGLELKLNPPVFRNTVLAFDRPWEGPFSGYPTILEDDGLYRLYYRGYPSVDSGVQLTCYAESRDGITFTKPGLGLYEITGSTDNNVVLPPERFPMTHNFTPFIDEHPNPAVPHRYKALGGDRNSGLIAYVSDDGIRWDRLTGGPVITDGAFDSQNVAFYSTEEQRYLCYLREWTTVDGTSYRSIYRTTSENFLEWTDIVEMDYGDSPREHLYTNQTQPYPRAPHIYLSLPMRFMPGRRVLGEEEALLQQVDEKYRNDCADVVFMSSRAGTTRYDRRFMEAFIRPGPDPGNWASRAAITALNVVQTGPEELSIYRQSHYAQPSARLDRYTLRLDGFASVRAGYDGGELVTKPIIFDGSELVINVSTSAAGSVLVELQEVDGTPIRGHALRDAMMLTGDWVEKTVGWVGGTSVSSLSGRELRIRFVMRDADLYSFRFR